MATETPKQLQYHRKYDPRLAIELTFHSNERKEYQLLVECETHGDLPITVGQWEHLWVGTWAVTVHDDKLIGIIAACPAVKRITLQSSK